MLYFKGSTKRFQLGRRGQACTAPLRRRHHTTTARQYLTPEVCPSLGTHPRMQNIEDKRHQLHDKDGRILSSRTLTAVRRRRKLDPRLRKRKRPCFQTLEPESSLHCFQFENDCFELAPPTPRTTSPPRSPLPPRFTPRGGTSRRSGCSQGKGRCAG